MGNLQPIGDARRTRSTHPQGFEPGIRWDSTGNLASVTIHSAEDLRISENHRKAIEDQTGEKIPAWQEVRIERLTLESDADGGRKWWFKYVFPEKVDGFISSDFDPAAQLKKLRPNRKAVTPAYDGEATLVTDWADWQIGKSVGGGSLATMERFDSAIEQMTYRAKELKRLNRNAGRLVVVGGGDLVEGCFIYPNQSFELDMDRRTQINTVTTMLQDGLDRLAPLFSNVTVLAVPGNHGEHRMDGNKTTRFDNDDCLVFENVARVAERDPRLGHVNFVIAQSEMAKTIDVNGWILGATHGQAYGKTPGQPIQKAYNWYKNQAAGRQPIGDADVLCIHHFHHEASADFGAVYIQQWPALDGGSPQYTDYAGQAAKPGMGSFVMTPTSRFQDKFITVH